MKTSYEERALKFVPILLDLFANCKNEYDFRRKVREYNLTHKNQLVCKNGVSRVAIIRSDYVIKFDICAAGQGRKRGRYGNCESEQEVYKKACKDHMEHLLAKTTVYHMAGRTFSIMPRINGVGGYRDYEAALTYEENKWLFNNVNDLHGGNYGWYKGQPIIIDYAWDAE